MMNECGFEELRLIKLIFTGNSGVGKTSILRRFCGDDIFNPPIFSTMGVDFKTKMVEIDGKEIKLQLWDKGGQERFRTIWRAEYYRGAKGIILVYDITSSRSFDDISNWMRDIKENADNGVEIILLGNNCEMENKREITKERGENLAKEYGIQFFETSFKTNINIDESIMSLSERIYRKHTRA